MMKKDQMRSIAICWMVLSCLVGSLLSNSVCARPPYSSSYFYITDEEQCRYGDYQTFWMRDTLPRRIRTNHDLSIINAWEYFTDSLFVGGVVISGGIHPVGLVEHARQVIFPQQATELRDAAARNGYWLNSYQHHYTYGLLLEGQSAIAWRWATGTPSHYGDPSQAITTLHWDTTRAFPIFCDGELWVKAITRGKLGIGAAGSIRIMGDLRCEDATSETGWRIPVNSPNSITLISEAGEIPYTTDRPIPWQGILIANTWENGRENGRFIGVNHPERNDVVITAQLIALNGSFTIEDQNDTNDAYQCTIITSDERGALHFHGSIMQKQRNYLHRATHAGTGYDKDWIWDVRFRDVRAPFSIPIVER